MTLTSRAAGFAFSAIGSLLFGLAPVEARTPQAIDLVKKRCDDASMHVDTEICYRDAIKKTQVAIERAFNRRLQAASVLDRQFNAEIQSAGIPRSFLAVQLKSSQAAWLSYAKFQCSFEGNTSFGGSGTDILEAACNYRLNALRLAELRANDRLLNR